MLYVIVKFSETNITDIPKQCTMLGKLFMWIIAKIHNDIIFVVMGFFFVYFSDMKKIILYKMKFTENVIL